MSELGRDCAALERRLQTHQRFAKHEINDWILDIVRPAPGERILDVGCGSGKQLLALAERVGRRGEVVGLDVSAQALQSIQARLAETPREARVRLVRAAMEDADTALPQGERYDLVLGCFSLYYSRDPGATLAALCRRLAPGGRAFACGPTRDNNREFVALCDSAVPREAQTRRLDDTLTFMEAAAPGLFGARFSQVSRHEFENPLEFPDPESVLGYWRSYHLFSPDHEAPFRAAVQAHFERHGCFRTVKRVAGVLAR